MRCIIEQMVNIRTEYRSFILISTYFKFCRWPSLAKLTTGGWVVGQCCCPGQCRLCTTGGIHRPLPFGTRQTGSNDSAFPGRLGVPLWFESLLLNMRLRLQIPRVVCNFEITGVAVLLHWQWVALCFYTDIGIIWIHLGVNRVWFVTNVSRTFREGSGFSKFHSAVVSSAIRPCLCCIKRKWKLGKDGET